MDRIEWLQNRALPACVAHALESLSFEGGAVAWPEADNDAWQEAIYYLNRNQLTLLVGPPAGSLDALYAANRRRLARVRSVTDEVVSTLERAGVEMVLVKGFARVAEYVPDPESRMHYDIDLLCPEAADAAAEVLRESGFVRVGEEESSNTGHLPPMVKPHSWKWRGDFFDVETPVHVEIHRRLWTPEFEGIAIPDVEAFWSRRVVHGGYRTLSEEDTLAYRSMHLLRHLLRGDFRASAVYEIAYFLEGRRADDAFWSRWAALHSPELQRVQGIAFALARRWFGCGLHATAASAIEALPSRVIEWMQKSAASPAESFFTPGKQELELHFALVESMSAKVKIAARRLVPTSGMGKMWESRGQYLARVCSRAGFHLRALVPTLWRLLIIRR